jgi:AcrR family transcriptional regulator
MVVTKDDNPAKARQARALRTRDSLLTAAASVIDRQGFAAAHLGEVANEADVTKGALYFHFPSKSAIAIAIVEQHHEQCASLMRQTKSWGLDGIATLERFLNELAISYQRDAVTRAGFRLGNEHPRIGTDMRMPYLDLVGWVQELLSTARDDGSLEPDVDPTVASRIIVGSFSGIQEMSAQLTNFDDLVQRIREWWSFVRPALARPQPSPTSDEYRQ